MKPPAANPALADRHAFGVLLVLAATILWSTAGLFVRLVGELDVWKILGWRSLFAAIALAFIALLERRLETGPPPLVASMLAVPVAVTSMGAYVVSLTLTTVANVMVVYATVPLVAAGLAWHILKERPPLAALAASLLAVVGVIIMVGGAVKATDGSGIVVAAVMTIAMGIQIVMARKYPGMRMSRINMCAAAICAAIGLALAQPGLPEASQLIALAAFGITNTALAYYFVLVGARFISPAETGLISTLDVVLGPLWVWLLLGEDPGTYAIIGGVVVLAAVAGYLLSRMKQARPASARE